MLLETGNRVVNYQTFSGNKTISNSKNNFQLQDDRVFVAGILSDDNKMLSLWGAPVSLRKYEPPAWRATSVYLSAIQLYYQRTVQPRSTVAR